MNLALLTSHSYVAMPTTSKYVDTMADASDEGSSGEDSLHQSDIDFLASDDEAGMSDYERHSRLLQRQRLQDLPDSPLSSSSGGGPSRVRRPPKKKSKKNGPTVVMRSQSTLPTVPLRAESPPAVAMSPLNLAAESKDELSYDDQVALELKSNEAHASYPSKTNPVTDFCVTLGFGKDATMDMVMAIKAKFNEPERMNKFIKGKDGCEAKLKFITWQLEAGADTGFLHLQTFMTVKAKNQRNTMAVKFFKLHLPEAVSCFVGVRKGTVEEAIDYCEKGDTQVRLGDDKAWEFTWGERPVTCQGKRTDIKTLVDSIKGGASMAQLREELPQQMCRMDRFAQSAISDRDYKIAQQMTVERNKRKTALLERLKRELDTGLITKAQALEAAAERMEGDREWWVFWGKSGGGKTHAAYTRCGARSYEEGLTKVCLYTINEDFANTLVSAADTIFIDEMDKATARADGVHPRLLLNLADTHVATQKQKGTAPHIYQHDLLITAGNTHPRQWLPQTPEILRRITRVYKFVKTFDEAFLDGTPAYEMTIVTNALREKWVEEAPGFVAQRLE